MLLSDRPLPTRSTLTISLLYSVNPSTSAAVCGFIRNSRILLSPPPRVSPPDFACSLLKLPRATAPGDFYPESLATPSYLFCTFQNISGVREWAQLSAVFRL